MTSRRGFLSFLGAAVASATLDPERLLWVPGAKVYSLPPKVLHGATIRIKNANRATSLISLCGESGIFSTRDVFQLDGQKAFMERDHDGKWSGDCLAYMLPTDWRTHPVVFPRDFRSEVVI